MSGPEGSLSCRALNISTRALRNQTPTPIRTLSTRHGTTQGYGRSPVFLTTSQGLRNLVRIQKLLPVGLTIQAVLAEPCSEEASDFKAQKLKCQQNSLAKPRSQSSQKFAVAQD